MTDEGAKLMSADRVREQWRLGKQIPINVYDGDRPVCQCHTAADAKLIVRVVNDAEASRNAALDEAAARIDDLANGVPDGGYGMGTLGVLHRLRDGILALKKGR